MFRAIRATLLAGIVLAAMAGPTLAAAPGNDDIASPETIGAIPYTNAQDTTEATTGATDPDCYGTGPTVWYAFTAADDGWLAADTIGSDYDTTLVVITAGGEFVGCNDDYGSLQSRVRFEAQAGITYLFMAGSFGGGPGGALVFNLDATTAPIQVEITATLDSTGKFLRDGSALVGVTVSCNIEAFGYLNVGLSQEVGRFTVRGWGGSGFDCGPEPVHVELTVLGDTGKFAGGIATASLYAEAYSPAEDSYASIEISGSVRLRK